MPGDIAEDILENIFRQTISEFMRNGGRNLLDFLVDDPDSAWKSSFTYKVPNERVAEYQAAFTKAGIEYKEHSADEKTTTYLIKAEDINQVRQIGAELNDLGAEIEEVKPDVVEVTPEEVEDDYKQCFAENGEIDPEKCKELFDKQAADNKLLAANGIKAHAELNVDGFIDKVYDLNLDNERIMDLMEKFPQMTPDDAFGFALLATQRGKAATANNLEQIAQSFKEEGQPVSDLARGWLDRYGTLEQLNRPYVDFELDKSAYKALEKSSNPADIDLAEKLRGLLVSGEEAEMEGLDHAAGGTTQDKVGGGRTESISENDSVYTFRTNDPADLTELDQALSFAEAAGQEASIYPAYETNFKNMQLMYSRKRGLIARKKIESAMKEIKAANEKAAVMQKQRLRSDKLKNKEHGAR